MSGFPNSMRLKGLLWEIGSLVGCGTGMAWGLNFQPAKAIILNLLLLSSRGLACLKSRDAALHLGKKTAELLHGAETKGGPVTL